MIIFILRQKEAPENEAIIQAEQSAELAIHDCTVARVQGCGLFGGRHAAEQARAFEPSGSEQADGLNPFELPFGRGDSATKQWSGEEGRTATTTDSREKAEDCGRCAAENNQIA